MTTAWAHLWQQYGNLAHAGDGVMSYLRLFYLMPGHGSALGATVLLELQIPRDKTFLQSSSYQSVSVATSWRCS